MPQPQSQVVGLIEIELPATSADLKPRPANAQTDRFRGQAPQNDQAPRCVVQLRGASSQELRANLERLCRELDAELARVHVQLKRAQATMRLPS